MASTRPCSILFSLLILCLCACKTHAQLRPHFYARGCPRLERIVRGVMESAVASDPGLPAAILRLFFHDCFVNGCDASLLLEDTATFTGEQSAGSNRAIRGMDVIQNIKSAVEAECSAAVSCADILALATRDGVVLSGGPNWLVLLGRRDAKTAALPAAVGPNLPPGSSNLQTLKTAFANKGLGLQELVALSGAHTVGVARCATFRNRLLVDLNIDSDFAALRRETCPAVGVGDPAPLDITTPTTFDNAYYVNLLSQKGLLRSDQELFNGGEADALVKTYASNQAIFFRDFANAMVQMGNLSPLTGTDGEIRQVCSRVN